jgi:serine/threonine protein kinase
MDGRVQARAPGDPRRLGPYELLGRLGQGGMGVAFLGRERRGGRLAAVKAIRPELVGDPAFAARFRREVEAARRVDSPQVARSSTPTRRPPGPQVKVIDFGMARAGGRRHRDPIGAALRHAVVDGARAAPRPAGRPARRRVRLGPAGRVRRGRPAPVRGAARPTRSPTASSTTGPTWTGSRRRGDGAGGHGPGSGRRGSPEDGGCDGKVSPDPGQPHRTSAPPPPPPTRPSPPPRRPPRSSAPEPWPGGPTSARARRPRSGPGCWPAPAGWR